MANTYIDVKESQSFLKGFDWLKPVEHLNFIKGADFGRHIEKFANKASATHQVTVIKVRKQAAMVVMPTNEYETLLSLKERYMHLLNSHKQMHIEALTNEYDALFDKISSSQSAKAASSLFEVSIDDLASAHKNEKDC